MSTAAKPATSCLPARCWRPPGEPARRGGATGLLGRKVLWLGARAARARAPVNGGSGEREETERRGRNGHVNGYRRARGSHPRCRAVLGGTGGRHGEARGRGGRRGRSPLCHKAQEEDDPAPGGLGLLKRQVMFFFLLFLFCFVLFC